MFTGENKARPKSNNASFTSILANLEFFGVFTLNYKIWDRKIYLDAGVSMDIKYIIFIKYTA